MISFDNLGISTIRSGVGDCIHVRFVGESGISRNIIIDSGPASAAGEFRRLCQGILNCGEKLDMLIITHYDADHIGGILKVGDLGIDSFFFNVYHGIQEMGNLSATQNQRLFHTLDDSKVHSYIMKNDVIELDGVRLLIHAPTEQALSRAKQYMKLADENLSAVGDWQYSFDELMNGEYPSKDTSLSNEASIVFVLEYSFKRLLFCGDAWEENIPGGKYDLVKLPHHGSSRNISDEMLDRIDANNFLICADGSRHPNKQTIAKLIKHYENITIYGNYNWWMKGFLNPKDLKYIESGRVNFKLV